MPRFERRDDIRTAFVAEVLHGEGVEIGAGAFPQRLPAGAVARYYDLRSDAEAETLFSSEVVPARPMSTIPTDFPGGADFLIAHNVLEHCPDPIGTLRQWHRLVRVGATVVVSLPHHLCCPDRGRRLPPLQHLIDDCLGRADGTDFPSREHTASFTLGWSHDYCVGQGLETIADFATRLLEGLHSEGHDVHWHALDATLSLGIVVAAAEFDGVELTSMRCWSPESGQTIGDVLISYVIARRGDPAADVQELLRIDEIRARSLSRLAGRIDRRVEIVRAEEPVAGLLIRPFKREGEHCFVAKLPASFEARIRPEMALEVSEVERPLGPGESLHETIRREGGGRFSFWKGWLYFSSSDGSDCNLNGRDYVVRESARG